MEKYYVFKGSLMAWLVGLPFLLLILAIKDDYRVNLLLLNINTCNDSTLLIDHINYLLKLLIWQSKPLLLSETT